MTVNGPHIEVCLSWAHLAHLGLVNVTTDLPDPARDFSGADVASFSYLAPFGHSADKVKLFYALKHEHFNNPGNRNLVRW